MNRFLCWRILDFTIIVADEDQIEEVEAKSDDEDPIQKYKKLLEDIEKKDEKKSNKDMEMEISWGIGIKDKAEELVKKKLNEGMLIVMNTFLNVQMIYIRIHLVCISNRIGYILWHKLWFGVVYWGTIPNVCLNCCWLDNIFSSYYRKLNLPLTSLSI